MLSCSAISKPIKRTIMNAYGEKDQIMRRLYLLLFIIMGLFLTACSGNTVKKETKKITASTIHKKPQVVNSRRRDVKISQPVKQVVKKVVKKVVKNRKATLRKNTYRSKYRKPYRSTYRKTYPKRNYQKRYVKKSYVKKRYTKNRYSKRRYVRRITPNYPRRSRRSSSQSFAKLLSNAAVARTRQRVRYDGRYVKIGYPWGDVPANIGVCTDVVIRSYRRLGIDLQKAVHEDMSQGGFYDYPRVKKWKLSAPDKNIDHRRVYNLQAFFRRHGASLPISHNPNHYKPGDLVTWMVGPSLPHIGVVVEQRSKSDPRRHMIVHNIGYGPKMEDVLFAFRITGHYRYTKNNKLIAGRRFQTNKTANIRTDYNRLMRELSAIPLKKSKKRKLSRRTTGTINIAQLQSESGISDADIRTLLGK